MSAPFDQEEIFHRARELGGDAREAFLRSACPDEAARQQIRDLLQHADWPTQEEGGSAEIHVPEPSMSAPPRPPRSPIATPPPGSDLPPGVPRLVGNYEVLWKIGEGGMGFVCYAEHVITRGPAAAKFIATRLAGDPTVVERFLNEARAAAQARHPAIVGVFDVGVVKGWHYILSEYVPGPTLAAEIRTEAEHQKDAPQTRDLAAWHKAVAFHIARVADALQACHDVPAPNGPIIHRDINPRNILIDRQEGARITDFGIAKFRGDDDRLTRPGTLVGTLPYMSPEQALAARHPIDHRSDIFSLGSVLYEALTLRRAFDAPEAKILMQIIADHPPRARIVDARIPRDLQTICEVALEKSPDRRYPTAAHMAADLRAWLNNRPIPTRPPGAIRRAGRWAKRHRIPIAAAGAVALAGALALMSMVVVQARHARLATFSVTAPSGCVVRARRVDPSTLEFAPETIDLGTTPRGLVRVEPGVYRVTVIVPSDGRFAEIDIRALVPGDAAVQRIRVVESPRRVREDRDDAALWAVLMTTPDSRAGAMHEVAGGPYTVGWNDDPELKPELRPLQSRRQMQIDPFLIDVREVSNRDYALFRQETGWPAPVGWRDGSPMIGASPNDVPPELMDRPVTGLTLADAEAYARWAGKRLPTAWEWEAATRRADGALLVFGEQGTTLAPLSSLDPTCDTLRTMRWGQNKALWKSYVDHTVDVMSPDPLLGADQIQHAFDNVRELTSTIVPSGEVVIKGRGWGDLAEPDRLDLTLTTNAPFRAGAVEHGFRCARSLAPPPSAAGGKENH